MRVPRECELHWQLYSAWMVQRQSRWRSKCCFVPWQVRTLQVTGKHLNMEDILILCRKEKSMLHCFILLKRCRTCRSQSRFWTWGRRGTFSTSWEWRARSKGCGQSSGRLNRTERRSSTKTFRYTFVWCLRHHRSTKERMSSKDTWGASELINFNSWWDQCRLTTARPRARIS